VGKTAIGVTTEGAEVRNNGLIAAGRDLTGSSGSVLYLNRIGVTDGPIQTFYKDGTTVGVIGVADGDNFYISSDDTTDVGLKFDGDANAIYACTATGAIRDNAVTLGDPAVRFKDLYLSGSVYLGGTTSANALDDYEEGTWTPVAASYDGTMTVNAATYEKIGRQVTVRANLTFDGTADSSAFILTSLPFSQPADAGAVGIVDGSGNITTFFETASTQIRARKYDGSSVTYTSLGAATIQLTYIYQTTA
jgi:hypothetical protein